MKVNSKTAHALQHAFQHGEPAGILVVICTPPPEYFRANIARSLNEILARGVIVPQKCHKQLQKMAVKIPRTSKGSWGYGFEANAEGYDKMMVPDKVRLSLVSNIQDYTKMICAGYTQMSFRRTKASIEADKKNGVVDNNENKHLEADFTVVRLHQLPPDVIKRYVDKLQSIKDLGSSEKKRTKKSNDIGKMLHLKSADFPGPAFFVALPIAAADDSDGSNSDVNDEPAPAFPGPPAPAPAPVRLSPETSAPAPPLMPDPPGGGAVAAPADERTRKRPHTALSGDDPTAGKALRRVEEAGRLVALARRLLDSDDSDNHDPWAPPGGRESVSAAGPGPAAGVCAEQLRTAGATPAGGARPTGLDVEVGDRARAMEGALRRILADGRGVVAAAGRILASGGGGGGAADGPPGQAEDRPFSPSSLFA